MIYLCIQKTRGPHVLRLHIVCSSLSEQELVRRRHALCADFPPLCGSESCGNTVSTTEAPKYSP